MRLKLLQKVIHTTDEKEYRERFSRSEGSERRMSEPLASDHCDRFQLSHRLMVMSDSAEANVVSGG